MTKTLATTLGISSLVFNGWVIALHTAMVSFFYDTHQQANVVRLILALAVLAYAWLPFTRYAVTRTLVASVGILLLVVGCGSLVTSQLFGVSYYMLPIDMFLAVEWGIISLLVAFELPIRRLNLYPRLLQAFSARSFARSSEPRPSMSTLTTAK